MTINTQKKILLSGIILAGFGFYILVLETVAIPNPALYEIENHNKTLQLQHEVNVLKQVKARITEYGWTGNRTASGKYPEVGMVATSDRTIPFGTKVVIEGKTYTVADRTARWVHEKFEYPTFDIYSENPSGLKTTLVTIIK